MYKVLLVDDEPMALEGLKYVVDWQKLGFLVCGTCWNGKQAAVAIDKYEPDIIITDIKMPVMDGLDLIQYALEHGKENIEFIVVSGYGEFEYAKKAMQYGVRYYLQKPIFKEEINEIIIEVKQQLDTMRRDKESSQMDQKAVLNGVLIHLLLGSDRKEDIEHLKSFFHEDMLLMGWNCIVIEIEPFDQLDIKVGFNKNTRLNIRKAIDKVVESNLGFFVIEKSSNTIIILASLNNEEQRECKLNNMAVGVYKSLISVVSLDLRLVLVRMWWV